MRKKCENRVFWLMGPSSSGKTTLAKKILEKLHENGELAIHYDGDEIRNFFGTDFGFDSSDRLRIVKTLVHLVNKAFDSSLNVIVSALTANKDARDYVENNVKGLFLIYLNCSIEKCIDRDAKGLYQKALKGEIKTMIGVNTPYIPPDKADLILDTQNKSVNTCVNEFIETLS